MAVFMLVTMLPAVPAATQAAGEYDDSINIPIVLGGGTDTRGQAMARTLEYSNPSDGSVIWKHPEDYDEFIELLESTDEEDTYISLTEDMHDRWKHECMTTKVIQKTKVLDLNGHTVEFQVDSNARFWSKGLTEQSPRPRDDLEHHMATAFEITNEATFYILDTSAKYTDGGTGRIYIHGYCPNPYKYDVEHFSSFDLFHVEDGNLVIYGGHFQAGRSKVHFKSNFSWSKLKNVIGQAVELGVSVASYATGIDAAVAAKDDVVEKFKKISEDTEALSPGIKKAEKADPKTTNPDGKKDMQTIGEKQDGIDHPKPDADGNIPALAKNNSTNGEQKANDNGSAKTDKNSAIAKANKDIVDATVNQSSIQSIVNTAFNFVEGIAGMIGVDQNSRITQINFGTCVRVGSLGTFVSYGGDFQGYGASNNTRNAVVEVVRGPASTYDPATGQYSGGRAYIFGGTFEGRDGANIFNIVEAAGNSYRVQQINQDESGVRHQEMVTIEESESMGVKEMKYETNGTTPIDTANVQVRGGTFKNHYAAKYVGIKSASETEHFTSFIGTSGSMNLGITSFSEDFIRDGRIQIIDTFGNGALVLLDDKSGGDGDIYHYRLFCSDMELRFKQGLRVYPNTARTNTTNSFRLKTQLNGGDEYAISTVFKDDEENVRGAYSTTERLFYYPVDDESTSGYTIKPTFKNLDPDGESLATSPTWYYQEPVDAYGDPIKPLRINDLLIFGTLVSGAIGDYKQNDPSKVTNSFNSTLNTMTSTFGGKTYVDARTVENISMKNLMKVFDKNYDVLFQDYNYVSNMKWFEYKVYKVDPLTRLNLRKDGKIGDDDPIAVAVYGDQARKGLKTMIRLIDLEAKIQQQDPTFKFRQGEMYRITLDVEERLGFDYNGNQQYSTNAYNANTDTYAYTTNLNTAKASSSVLFLCYGSKEHKYSEEYNKQTYDYTPLQWDAPFKAGQRAKINFVNAKTGNVDWETNMIHDIYYQWWIVDDNGKKETLLAGTTNVWDIAQNYQSLKAAGLNRETMQAELNRNKDQHKPSWWMRGKDGFLYANTLAPDDPLLQEKDESGNLVEYENGLPKIRYNGNNIDPDTNNWPKNNDAIARLIHAYSLQWVNEKDLRDTTAYDLSNQNNNQDYGSTDTCYIPKELAGKKIMVEAVAVNVNWTDYYDAMQTFYSHVYQIPERSFEQPLGGEIGIDYGKNGNYISIFNNATLSLDNVTGLEEDEYITNVQYSVGYEGHYYRYKEFRNLELKAGDPIPTAQFPKDFYDEKYLKPDQGYASIKPGEYTVRVKYQTNLEEVPKRYFDYSTTDIRFEVEAEGVISRKDSYTFDIEDLKSGKVQSGDIKLFTIYPLNYTLGLYFDSAKSTDSDVAYIDANGCLAFGGNAGVATLSYTGPDGKTAKIQVEVIDYVDDVEITNINPPEIDAHFRTDVEIPDDADYHVKEVYWTDGAGERLDDNAVADFYKAYTINVVIEKNDPILKFKEMEPWCYDNVHPFTMEVTTAEDGLRIITNDLGYGRLDYVENPATGEYEVGDTCRYYYTFTRSIGDGPSVIDTVKMDFPTEVTEGDSVDEWMEQFYTGTNADRADRMFLFQKGFSWTSFAEYTFKAYGYHVDPENPTDTMKSFMRGTIDGPKVIIDLNPNGDNVEVGFADEADMKVYVNGEIDPRTEIHGTWGAGSDYGIFNVPGALTVLDGRAIPPLPKYRVKDFNLVKGKTVYLDELLETEGGSIRLEPDLDQMEAITAYVDYDEVENSLFATAATSEPLKIPLYITVDGNGDGIVDMRVNENRQKTIFATQGEAPQLDNGYPIDVHVKTLKPDGSVAYEKDIEAIRYKDYASIDIPEVDGTFFTGVEKTGDPDFAAAASSWAGRYTADLKDGDSIVVKTVDVNDIVVKTSETEIYPDFPEAGDLCVSLDGDHWTTSKVAFTGLDPDTEYVLYYKQGIGEYFYTKPVRTKPEGDDYGVYVGRAPLTKSDPGDLERDGFHYDAASKTLTLKNYSITDMGIDVEYEKFLYAHVRSQSVIYSKKDLTIELIGDNYIEKLGGESNFLLGNIIRGKGNITFKGDGNLTLKGNHAFVQSVQAGDNKDIYLKGTGKITFENCGYGFYNLDGKVYYMNGELDFNNCGTPLKNLADFDDSGKKHDYTVYVTENDAETVQKLKLTEDEVDRILEDYNYNNDVLKYSHLVPNHNFNQQTQSVDCYVSGDCSKGATYYMSCSCGAVDHEHTFKAAAASHDMEHFEGKDATCIESGYKAYDTCKKCGYTTFKEIPAKGHSYTHHKEVHPTCDTDGCPAYDVCKVCGYSSLDKKIEAAMNGEDVVRDDLWIATGHDVIFVAESAAVKCGANGMKEHYKCVTCGHLFADETGTTPITKEELVTEPGHNLTAVPGKDAVKGETGNIPYYICEDCGEWFYDGLGTEKITNHDSTITFFGDPVISKKKASLKAGKTLTLKVTNGIPALWKSSKTGIATVSKTGKVTALKKGSTTITAMLADGKKVTCKITVSSNPTIKINKKAFKKKTTYTVKKGKTLNITITGKAPGVNNVYSTSKKKIAKVISKKTATKIKIKGLKKGSATVTVKVNGFAFKIKVKVK